MIFDIFLRSLWNLLSSFLISFTQLLTHVSGAGTQARARPRLVRHQVRPQPRRAGQAAHDRPQHLQSRHQPPLHQLHRGLRCPQGQARLWRLPHGLLFQGMLYMLVLLTMGRFQKYLIYELVDFSINGWVGSPESIKLDGHFFHSIFPIFVLPGTQFFL